MGATVPTIFQLLAGSLYTLGAPAAHQTVGANSAGTAWALRTPAWLDTAGNFTASQTITKDALGTTTTAALTLINNTAAAAGAQQVSGATVWTGQGWKTNSTAASQSVVYAADVLPVQGATQPEAIWRLRYSINGAAFKNRMLVYTDGSFAFRNAADNGSLFDMDSVGSIQGPGAYRLGNGGNGEWSTNYIHIRSDSNLRWSSTTSLFNGTEMLLGRAAVDTFYMRGDSAVSVAPTLQLQGKSSTTSGRKVWTAVGAWGDSTDASRKGRAIFNASDNTADRECIRIESDGAAGMIGLLGATATARESVTGSRGGNAALADLITKLATKGIITDGSSA